MVFAFLIIVFTTRKKDSHVPTKIFTKMCKYFSKTAKIITILEDIFTVFFYCSK